MTPTRYIVLEHAGQWKINFNNQYYGPFESRDTAVESATQSAREAVTIGHNAQVMVMSSPAHFDTVWTAENDKVPQPPFAS